MLIFSFLYCVVVLSPSAPCLAVEFFEIIEENIEAKNQNQHGMRLEHFDQWVFQNQTKVDGARKQLVERLKAEAQSVQASLQLTALQTDKLELAGRGDIQSFMQEYADTRAKFERNLHDQQAVQNIWQEIQPLQRKYHGQIFGEVSLYSKVLAHMLDEHQSALVKAWRREQREFRYQAAVRLLVSQLDQVAPITHERREQLLALIDQYTHPPKSISGSQHSQYLTYYVLGQLAEIPEDKLRPLFRATAWRFLSNKIRQGKRMKPNLEQQGLVPDEG